MQNVEKPQHETKSWVVTTETEIWFKNSIMSNTFSANTTPPSTEKACVWVWFSSSLISNLCLHLPPHSKQTTDVWWLNLLSSEHEAWWEHLPERRQHAVIEVPCSCKIGVFGICWVETPCSLTKTHKTEVRLYILPDVVCIKKRTQYLYQVCSGHPPLLKVLLPVLLLNL